MGYRKYSIILNAIIILGICGLSGCASNPTRNPDSAEEYNNGNEPGGDVDRRDFTWLNQVQDDFSKVATIGTNRAIASQEKEVLFSRDKTSFYYQKKNNQFYLQIKGQTFPMVQANMGESNQYSFAAQGAENPPTMFINTSFGPRAPSSYKCEINLSYFVKDTSHYKQNKFKFDGGRCQKLTQKLKDYVP